MSTSMLVPKSPQPPKPPSVAEIMAMLPGLRLYNPSSEWLQLNVHGRTDLWMPPDLGGAKEPHPITRQPVTCDGILEVKGRYLTQKDSSGKTIEGQDAHAVVSYVIRRGQKGDMGVVWLPGRDPEEDERYMDYSRDTYLKYQAEKDEAILQKRREFKANWLKNDAHKGKPVPPPTPAENLAMERSQRRESVRTYQFECDVVECPGYASNDWQKFREHMVAAHGFDPKREKYEGDVQPTSGVGVPVDDADEVPVETSAISEAADILSKQTAPRPGRKPRAKAKRS